MDLLIVNCHIPPKQPCGCVTFVNELHYVLSCSGGDMDTLQV